MSRALAWPSMGAVPPLRLAITPIVSLDLLNQLTKIVAVDCTLPSRACVDVGEGWGRSPRRGRHASFWVHVGDSYLHATS